MLRRLLILRDNKLLESPYEWCHVLGVGRGSSSSSELFKKQLISGTGPLSTGQTISRLA